MSEQKEEQTKDQKKSAMEIADQTAEIIEKMAKKADNAVGSVKEKSGDHGSKIMVVAIVLLALALYKHSDLWPTAIVLVALVYLKPILSMVKKFIKKDAEKKVETKEETTKTEQK